MSPLNGRQPALVLGYNTFLTLSVAGKGGACFKAQRAERWIKPMMR